MRSRLCACTISFGLTLPALSTAWAGDWPWKKAKPGEPNTLEEVARSIDCLEDKILDDGTVVIKKPDVYGQSRMTLYRRDFEKQMYGAITKFNTVLSARLYRSDQAALSSQTNVAAGLASAASKAKTTTSTTTNVVTPTVLPAASSGGITPAGLAANSIVRPNTIAGELGANPFTFGGTGAGVVGLEPTVYLDELKDYQDHLNQIRRTNMGDDIADSAGYGLYLLRMPVSIQPGECTRKGHGAVLTATLRHDFGPDFLPKTFRNLAINDLVDQLTPIVFELIRCKALQTFLPQDITSPTTAYNHYLKITKLRHPEDDMTALFRDDSTGDDKTTTVNTNGTPQKNSQVVKGLFPRMNSMIGVLTRTSGQQFPVASTEINDVFLEQNIVMLAAERSGGLADSDATIHGCPGLPSP